MDEQVDAPEVIETPVEEVETPAAEPQEEVEAEVEAETSDERDSKIAELEETNKKLYARAKKAEAEKKPVAPSESPMSLADATALLKADVHEDDIERVEKFAKAEGLSIREALKNDELKAILQVRTEKRTTAQAANVSNVRRGPSKVTDETLLDNANAGKLPDSDADIARLIAAKSKANRG